MLTIPIVALAVCLVLAYGASITLWVRERKAQDLLASRDGCRISGVTRREAFDIEHDMDDIADEAARREWAQPGFDFYAY